MLHRIFVGVLVAISAAYCWGLLWLAWGFSRAGGLIGWGLAAGVMILLVLTLWVIWRELLFGMAAARLNRRYRESSPTPAEPGPDHAEAAPDCGADGAADGREEFEKARSALQNGEEDWRAWFRLALAYEGLRDRKQARAAVRRAIALDRGR
ncbi:hypothetical protein [Brachybacterium phenoliresistens]|uniref:Tetratricopeptide repeat protein n=1 Tax=Brachybacterium phenoliresistens TaxID=396014 RepID=Z9JS58_9MICO|nr:hypothetical protein [Brachybacterium phenoliresistens]EWS81215.1 hypothetical protein BF93_18785 [Brachybacterium phenoliresistens]